MAKKVKKRTTYRKEPKGMASLSVDALFRLRDEVASAISARAADLQAMLSRLGEGPVIVGGGGGKRRGRPPGKRRSLAGRKVAPKYRGPGGETWAGRGAKPRWLVAELKKGKKLESFAINKAA